MPRQGQPEVEKPARLRIILHRSLATKRLHVGNAAAAAAIAVRVSVPFMLGALAITSPVAGLTTCNVQTRCLTK